MGDPGEVRAPAGIDLAFMRKLDPAGRTPMIVPGGSYQAENAARQRCVRRGWVVYRNTGSVFRGWMLTKAGIDALAAPPPTAGGPGAGTADGARTGGSMGGDHG